MKLQPAVKTETGRIAIATVVGVLIMYAGFFCLHMVFPKWAPFDYKVILGGIFGATYAIGNFFLMAVTVQKVASMDDEKEARTAMGVSYRNRFLLLILWGILGFAVPVFNVAAVLITLFIPTLFIKLRGIISAGKGG
ncbi:MAG: ATP synthase subunit I [Butyrivibrio sp.]|nr:ATP synthase subunit I [Butyrivibrio sp.]